MEQAWQQANYTNPPGAPPSDWEWMLMTSLMSEEEEEMGQGPWRSVFEEMRTRGVNRDKVVFNVVCRLLQSPSPDFAPFNRLFGMLRIGYSCQNMKVRGIDAIPVQRWRHFAVQHFDNSGALYNFLEWGMKLETAFEIPAESLELTDWSFDVREADVWYWAIRAGASDVAGMLANNKIKPLNIKAVSQPPVVRRCVQH